MSDRKSTLTAVLVDSVSGPAKKIQGEITGIGDAARAATVAAGVGIEHMAELIGSGIGEIISKLADVIPSLITSGNDYLGTLREIQLETGMTAEETSGLVGAMSSLGIPIGRIEPLLARFSKQLESNEGKFRALGVATRDSSGKMLDATTIIENLRHQVQAHGETLLSTAAAQELFGKSGSELLPYLQKTDAQIDELNKNTARWGGIMSQQAVTGAEDFKVGLASLAQGITDVGANIAAALDPYLQQFIEAFSRFVQDHLNEIINFAVGVANAIIGFVSGLFGITNALTSTDEPLKNATKNTGDFSAQTKKAAGDEDAFTKSIHAQINAIDAHTKAIEDAAARRHAARERERLQQSVSDARAQLKDLQGNDPFLGGLSAAEQVLAVQKHAQDIVDAKKKVNEATQSLGDFEADQKDRAERELLSREKSRLQDSLEAHKKANAAILASGLRMSSALDANAGGVLKNINIKTEEYGKTAAAAFKIGADAAKSLLGVLIGVEEEDAHGVTIRTGGLFGAIRSVIDAMGGLPKIFDAVAGAAKWMLDQVGPVFGAFDDMGKQLDFLETSLSNAGVAVHNFIGTLIDAVSHIPFLNYNPFLPNGKATGGWVGVHGPEIVLVGEQGPEYVVPNHALGGKGGGGAGGGGKTELHVHFDFLSMPSDEQLRKLTQEVSSRLAFSLNHAPVTSMPNGSF